MPLSEDLSARCRATLKQAEEFIARYKRLQKSGFYATIKSDGGKGSGNFGHGGRKGQVGGSAPSGYVNLPKKEYAELCSAVRTRYTNKIPKTGGAFLSNKYYRFTYNRHTAQIRCTAAMDIEGNEEKINLFDKEK